MIDIYYAIATENPAEITCLTSCGILLILHDEQNTRCRLLGYGLAGSPRELANLQAVRLALAAINPAFRKTPTVIHTVDGLLTTLLASPGEYAEAVYKLLRWCDSFADIGFTIDSSNSENISICRSLAKRICATQESYDSSTMDRLPDEQV